MDELRLVLNQRFPTDFLLRLWGTGYSSSSEDLTVTEITGGVQYAWSDPDIYFEVWNRKHLCSEFAPAKRLPAASGRQLRL